MPSQDTKKARREAARQARIEAQRAREKARKRKRMMLWAGLTALAVVAAFFGYQKSQETDKARERAAKTAGCKAQSFKKLEASPHLNPGDPAPKYNSTPPTSGLHEAQPAPWGVSDEAIEDKTVVHNLEHGGIVIHYKGLPGKDVDALNDLVDSYPDGVIAQPNDKIKNPIAMTAWGEMQTCKKADTEVIKAFVSAHCNKGPEKLGLRCG